MAEIILNEEQALHEYSTAIEPALNLVIQACKERGFSFLAVIDVPQANTTGVASVQGETQVSEMMFLVQAAAKAEGSFDKLISILRELKIDHRSVALHLLGVGAESDEKLLSDQLPLLYNLAVRANLHEAAVWVFNRMMERFNDRNPNFDHEVA